MNNLILVAIFSTVLSFLLTPLVKKFAIKVRVIDVPKDKRRVHKKPIPLLGGLAIYISFITTLLLKSGPLTNQEKGIILGATLIVIGGFLDDKYEIKPLIKLLFQISAAVILIIFGVRIVNITNPFPNYHLWIKVGWLSIPLTILWVVGITNSINLIDGLDGLAAGVALISCITLFIIALFKIDTRFEAAFLTCALSGAILGFLPYNFNPASIFMGDTGAQLLGFLLAAISIEGAIKSAAAFAISVPILALGLPIYDTLFAMVRRKINGKPIMGADRGHLHHRLLDMGLTQRQAVIIMYLISAILGSFAILAMQISSQSSYFLLAVVMLILVLMAWKCGFFKHRE
ncbi:UDP-GlcNAc:undecaprenyl-phosphate GlcNAc-1-phosphate transferase [Clostridium tetanomorphum]|uniref:Undecaprenyl/decaprenyl-phosphate alpha-N-acetylglucosaminyl 1-phosphate transferase n=1 Tax=Clostridium tetanomorphum TaxID=1553 RepID=A0A923J2Z1_CLOTT|nr:MraY family glycosyltransferase [Clostridium tetanomorphum]KAJ48779.1 undecaprenyl-phosphate alpha-N-acetylglucosaminyltransferase [Clostridium tetanomorphum DSM 665]KAJ53265.1 undecaprenyl-phosphate alpha-N-acetylglucosaminyltransferase [Clostridium tetanomorphum DSM 665]MBC2399385.1 undecaprenyl/decaprenyl-phosphate alpha-N-acetylglucosaminyl 1-phosphate transferase [Clostridium tetanomorphum]MBP1865703.1 UDP-GlcNAc:undecaprenyl-phosphate GlcNAc-1-phosphate transferase [Clostridium tetanom